MPSFATPQLNDLPGKPGCYLFYDQEGRLLYIGKAKDIRKRVTSYFQRPAADPKTAAMVPKIARVETIVTQSEVEAYILENSLIKKNQPHYNIDLKDAKQFAYLQVTDEAFPRIVLARRRTPEGKFFGPFVSGQERDDVRQRLLRIFRLRTCRRLPKKACLRFHIGLCTAPCIGRVGADGYRVQIDGAVAVLKGHTAELLTQLRREMRSLSERQDFEQAMRLRDQVAAIEKLKAKQDIDRSRTWDEDFVHHAVREGEMHVMIFHARRGIVVQKEEFVFAAGKNTFSEFLARYYSEHSPPREIVLPEAPDAALQAYLNRVRRLIFTVPRQGEKKRLLDLVAANIAATLFAGDRKLGELQKRLDLDRSPGVIECFDVSHISGTSLVASMVQFRLGRPDKRHYRRFRMRTATGSDDFAALAEVVRRRYSRLLAEKAEMPDLVIVDGGSGQLAAALAELNKLGLTIPAIAIAKRFEEIYLPGYDAPLALPGSDPALLFVREIRDEAHRFALAYHRLLRSKRTLQREKNPKSPRRKKDNS